MHESPEELARFSRLGSSLFSRVDPVLFLITAKHEARETGMIATWVLDASLLVERPRVIVVLSPSSLTAELIRESDRFVLHTLARGQEELVPKFGLSSGRDHDKLEGLDVERTEHGIAIVKGTAGHAECEVVGRLVIADREVLVATIAAEAVNLEREPLTLRQANERLPADVVAACEEQSIRDGERDSVLPLRGFLH